MEFTDVRVPAANIIGTPGDGIEIVNRAFSWTCSSIGAACVGRMRAAFDYAYEFAMNDKRSGPVPVIEYQNVGYMLADIKTRIEAVRYLAWKAADHFDKTGGKDRELANATKIFASETSVQVVYDAMRLVGVDAYSNLTPIAGIMQDVLCFRLRRRKHGRPAPQPAHHLEVRRLRLPRTLRKPAVGALGDEVNSAPSARLLDYARR
ncbi:acyl-CoA dehydrogenase family protein [Williamsia limnetica]|uniref:acyl-CoA dehydrogenase family protein n=1 Tax=Williamsia limnetica TaxID=882452 RepID=UPI001FE4DE44|nr:acyl-CoA dehydrogenase family protein [Williamsia limnetica]